MNVYIVMVENAVHAKASECPSWVCDVYATKELADDRVTELANANPDGGDNCYRFWVREEEVQDCKPCPFCGAEEMDPEENIPNLVDGMSTNGDYIFVTCLECGANGPAVEYEVDHKTSVVISWPDAVKAWNRRAP